jgi:hypothetical protein
LKGMKREGKGKEINGGKEENEEERRCWWGK